MMCEKEIQDYMVSLEKSRKNSYAKDWKFYNWCRGAMDACKKVLGK